MHSIHHLTAGLHVKTVTCIPLLAQVCNGFYTFIVSSLTSAAKVLFCELLTSDKDIILDFSPV